MFLAENAGKSLDVLAEMPETHSDVLKDLEKAYRVCDLLHLYCDKWHHPAYLPLIAKTKQQLSESIVALFEQTRLEHKKCERCGEELPWAFPYSICDACYEKQHGHPREDEVPFGGFVY